MAGEIVVPLSTDAWFIVVLKTMTIVVLVVTPVAFGAGLTDWTTLGGLVVGVAEGAFVGVPVGVEVAPGGAVGVGLGEPAAPLTTRGR